MWTTIIVLVVLYIFYILYTQQKAQHDVNKHLLNKLDKLSNAAEQPSETANVKQPSKIDLTPMWADLKLQEPGLKEIIELFLEPDKIDPDQFFMNMKVFEGMTYIGLLALDKGIPYDAAKEHMIAQLSPSMKKWQPHDLPPALFNWFIAAYPDVSKWLSELEEDKYDTYPFTLINDESAYVDGKCKLDILRVLIDHYAYNVNNKLECSTVSKIILRPVKEFNFPDGDFEI